MCKLKSLFKLTGYAALAFGAGVILTYFLPCSVLVVAEAAVIITSGIIYITNR